MPPPGGIPPIVKAPPRPAVNLRTGNNPRGVAILAPAPVLPPRMLTTGANPRGVAIIQPTPRPAPVANLRTGANPRGVAIVTPPSKPTINDIRARSLAATMAKGDYPGPQGDYGTAVANAFKQTPAYKQAVLNVFRVQSPHQQQAIIAGSLHNPVSPEAKMILDYARLSGIASMSGYGSQVQEAVVKPPSLATLTQSSGPIADYIAKLFVNSAKDAAQMGPGTLEGLYSVGKQGVQAVGAAGQGKWGQALGHVENAAGQVVDPYIQAAEHPIKTFTADPLNTAALAYGVEGAVGGIAGAAGRAAGIDALSTAREPLSPGTISGEPVGGPLAEERSYSKNVFHKGVQVGREQYIRKVLGQDPNVVRPAPRLMPQSMQDAFNVGQEAKLRRVGNEMASVQQTLQRAERGKMVNEANAARPKEEAASNVVTHILQNVVRPNTVDFPDRAREDLVSEAERLKNVRTETRSQGNEWNKQQVRDIERVLKTPGALEQATAAAEHLRPVINGQDAVLEHHAILTPEQITAKYFPYAQKHMGAIYDHEGRQLLQPTGQTHPSGAPIYKSLSTDEIRAHQEANGVPDSAYVGHYANKATPRQFYMRYVKSRGTLSQGVRTGEAFHRGGYDHTYEGLTGQMAARAQAVAKAGIHDRLVQRSYLKPKDVVANQVKQEWAKARAAIRKDPASKVEIEARTRKETANIRTGMYTPAEARAVIHAQPRDDYGNLMPSEIELEPIAASPQKTIEWTRDLQNPMQQQGVSDLEAQALKRAIDEAKGRTDGVRNVVLAPKVLTDQLTRQFTPGGTIERGIGRWVQQFRNTVLPYSTHWMAQIGTEAGLRAALAGVFSPHYIADAKALYERLGKTEAGRAAAAEMTGATFYGQHGTMGVYHSPNPLLRGAQNLRGTSDVIAAHKWYVQKVGKLMYSFEHNARMAGLGKLMHDHAAEIRQFGKGWQGALRLQGQVIDQIAHGLETNPALVTKFGRKIDDLFGQYGKYSPRTRAIIQTAAPFLPWYLAATKYVFWQLPIHHPVASALLASLRQTVNQDVADGKKEPLNAYATQALGTMSPFGIFTPESTKPADILKEAAQKGSSVFLPQAMGAVYGAVGRNAFGQALYGPHGEVQPWSPQAIGTAAESGIEGLVPLAGKARQALEGGRPSYGTSALWNPQPKPDSGSGDVAQILNRLFNPAYSFERAKASQPATAGPKPGPIGMKKFGSGGGGIGMKKFGG